MRRIRGNGKITAADFKGYVKWVGRTKAGKAITIKLYNAINMGDSEWAFADKGEVVSEVTFEGTYTQNELDAGSTKEPFEIICEDGVTSGESEIILGAGRFYINDVAVGLTRGGGKFKRGAVMRAIGADNDRGTVKDRVVMDEAKPTLTMSALELLTRVTELYPAMEEVDADEIEIIGLSNVTMRTTDERDVTVVTVPDNCTISASVSRVGNEIADDEALSASVDGNVITLEAENGTAGNVYTVTVTATKTNYSAAVTAFTVTLVN